MKLCKDCRYYSENPPATGSKCGSSKNRKGISPPDYVYGAPSRQEPYYYSAQIIREDDALCGPEANWFKPRS